MSFEEYMANSQKATVGEYVPRVGPLHRLQTDLHKSCGKQQDENPPILQA